MSKTYVAKVSYSLGATINLGNYESARFQIGMEVECPKKDMKKVYKDLSTMVEALAKQKAQEIAKGDLYE